MYVAVLSYQSLAILVAFPYLNPLVIMLLTSVPVVCPAVCAAHMRLLCVGTLHVGRDACGVCAPTGRTQSCMLCVGLPSPQPSNVGLGCWGLPAPRSPTTASSSVCPFVSKYLHVSSYLCRCTGTVWDCMSYGGDTDVGCCCRHVSRARLTSGRRGCGVGWLVAVSRQSQQRL